MGAVNFYLKKPEANGLSLIYLQFKYAGRKLVYSFGQSINPTSWHSKKQRVKSNKATTADGKHYLNDLLDALEKQCNTAYNSLLKTGIPAPSEIKKRLSEFMEGKPEPSKKETLLSLVERFVNNEIVYRGSTRKKNTVRSYKTTYNHLLKFSKETKTVTDFETITLDYYNRFVLYLRKKGLSSNSIGKEVKNLKTFMSEAVDLGYTDNIQFRHKKFAVSREDAEAIYLSTKEIEQLYAHDFADNKRYDEVRDLFIFGCCTGLRYSDYSTVKAGNVVKDGKDFYIKIKTQKTGQMVTIPCSPIVLGLFNKYNKQGRTLPQALSNQKFNDHIKDVCREAGLTDAGRLQSAPELELCECISSHTARRSFLTNYYLEGFPVIDLMKISGHTTEKSFMRYIKISGDDAARRLQTHIKKTLGKKSLRVAS